MDAENKTIAWLKTKAWHRLLIIIYIFAFIVLLVAYNYSVFFEIGLKNLNLNKTQIVCNYGDKKIFVAGDIKLNLGEGDFVDRQFNYYHFFSKGFNDYKIKDIFRECYNPTNLENLDVFAIQRTYEIVGTKEAKKEYDENYLYSEIRRITEGYKSNQTKANYLDFSVKLFDIKPVFDYRKFIKFFVAGNSIIIFMFWLVKGIFYYIILGKFRPKRRRN